MTTSKYALDLAAIESGFRACWQNAQDLCEASQVLLRSGFHAPAQALGVLALEELGRLFCLDALLFARYEDSYWQEFGDLSRNHSRKLLSAELFPLLLDKLLMNDPRWGTDLAFGRAINLSREDLGRRLLELYSHLGASAFTGLSRWKERGLYVHESDGGFAASRDLVRLEQAQILVGVAFRSVTTLDFVLKDGGLERYLGFARQIRSNLSDSALVELEKFRRHFSSLLRSEFLSSDRDEIN